MLRLQGSSAAGDVHGAGQVTGSTSVVTTAAHVLFDEEGHIRNGGHCQFENWMNGKRAITAMDLGPSATLRAGTAHPYDTSPSLDWAVIHLPRPIADRDRLTPYAIGDGGTMAAGHGVRFVSRGHQNWPAKVDPNHLSFEDCQLAHSPGAPAFESGPREMGITCSTGDGASSGAVLDGGGSRNLVAILSGWRSQNPYKHREFNSKNYNFVVTVEGDFKKAIEKEAATIDL